MTPASLLLRVVVRIGCRTTRQSEGRVPTDPAAAVLYVCLCGAGGPSHLMTAANMHSSSSQVVGSTRRNCSCDAVNTPEREVLLLHLLLLLPVAESPLPAAAE